MHRRIVHISGLAMAASLAVPALVGACSGDDDAQDSGWPESCQKLIDTCHYKDPGVEGPVNDCHTLGHDGVREACDEGLEECVEICESAPIPTFGEAGTDAARGEAGTDASTGDAGSDASSAEDGMVADAIPDTNG